MEEAIPLKDAGIKLPEIGPDRADRIKVLPSVIKDIKNAGEDEKRLIFSDGDDVIDVMFWNRTVMPWICKCCGAQFVVQTKDYIVHFSCSGKEVEGPCPKVGDCAFEDRIGMISRCEHLAPERSNNLVVINYTCFEIVKALVRFGMCFLEGGYESIVVPSLYTIRRWMSGLEVVFFRKKGGETRRLRGVHEE